YKLLNYFALLIRFQPKSIGVYLREQSKDRGAGQVDYGAIEPWTRVSPHDYEANLREMIRRSRAAGAAVVLLDNELWAERPDRALGKTMAADSQVPLVDSLQIVADARAKLEREVASRLRLAESRASVPPPDDPPHPATVAPTRIVFRVAQGRYQVPRAIAIAGTDPQLGDASPNTVWMRDDGSGGDERAGDGGWSLAATFAPGTRLSYVYTNSGTPGRWEGLDVPHIRTIVVPGSPDGGPVYLPIETFGEVYMQADDWHTNAVGYDLIARAVADAIATVNTDSVPLQPDLVTPTSHPSTARSASRTPGRSRRRGWR